LPLSSFCRKILRIQGVSADVSQKHHRKFDDPAVMEGSAVLEDSRRAMPRKIAASQKDLAVLAVLFFHACSTSGAQDGVEI
jgi:hypothetical protein